MARSLTIHFKNIRPLLVVRLEGFLAQLEVYKLKSRTEELIHDGCRFVILDLTNVKYIDSAGIGVITFVRDACGKLDGMTAIVAQSGSEVMRTLSVANIHRLVPFFATEQQAREEIAVRHGLSNITESESMTKVTEQPRHQTIHPNASIRLTSDPASPAAASIPDPADPDPVMELLQSMSQRINMIDQRLADIERALVHSSQSAA